MHRHRYTNGTTCRCNGEATECRCRHVVGVTFKFCRGAKCRHSRIMRVGSHHTVALRYRQQGTRHPCRPAKTKPATHRDSSARPDLARPAGRAKRNMCRMMSVADTRRARLAVADEPSFEVQRQCEAKRVKPSAEIGSARRHRDANHLFSVVSLALAPTTTTANCDPSVVRCAASRQPSVGGGLRSARAAQYAR